MILFVKLFHLLPYNRRRPFASIFPENKNKFSVEKCYFLFISSKFAITEDIEFYPLLILY